MGLLSALQFGQQSQWLPPWITPYGTPAQTQGQPAPFNPNWASTLGAATQQQPMPQPATPAPPRRRSPALSFTPQNAQTLPTDGGVQMRAAPAQTDAQLRAPTFNERLEGLYNSPLLNIGLSLLGNAQNGGDWGAVGRDMQAWQQGRRQQQREDNEARRLAAQDQRAETLFGYTREDRDRASEQRAALNAWVGTLSPEDQAAARANPQAAYEAFMEARAQATAPITPYQQATLALQRQSLNNSRYSPLSPSQQRLYRNDYESAQQGLADQVGPQVLASMSWAAQIGEDGLPPPNMRTADVLINDQGLLRAVARLQTGVGVLTEGEVRDTVGANIANQLQEQGAAFNLTTRLRPEVRASLARLVQDGTRRVSTRAWSARENALAAYTDATGGAPSGWSLPQFAHPDDMPSLIQAERIAGSQGAPPLRPNDVRIAPSGREYRYVGRGNWLPMREGNVAGYQAGRAQRLRQQQQQPGSRSPFEAMSDEELQRIARGGR